MATTAEEFRDVIGRFATGVTVITASEDGVPYGTTVSAVSSVSLDPPMVLVCLNTTSVTGQVVSRTRRFGVNILSEDQPEIAARFATKGDDKFGDVALTQTGGDVPFVADTLATLDCSVREVARGGTHTVFIAHVDSAAGTTGAPLGYFRGQFGRFVFERDDLTEAELRRRIVRGNLAAGLRLELEPLAADLEVPPGVVYHALSRLRAEGVVDRDPDGRYVVPATAAAAVVDALPALFSLWLGAMQLTLDEVTETELAELRERVDALRPSSVQDGSWSSVTFERAGREFAERFLALCRSPALEAAWAHADVPLTALLPDGASLHDAAYEAIYEHAVQVLDALAARDDRALANAVRRMLRFVVELAGQRAAA